MANTMQVPRVTQEIVSQMRSLITGGDLSPGDRLPAEREMARMFGVSRPSLREALQVLAYTGFVEIIRGSGVYVRDVADWQLFDPLHSLIRESAERHVDVYEFRAEIETWAVGLAAERCTRPELETLTRIVERMQRRRDTGQRVDELDVDFHLAIAKASHNQVYFHVIGTIVHLFAEATYISHKELFSSASSQRLLMKEHQAICDAIANRDAVRARRVMKRHLSRVISRVEHLSDSESERPEPPATNPAMDDDM